VRLTGLSGRDGPAQAVRRLMGDGLAPHAAVRSAALSWKHDVNRGGNGLITATWGSRIDRHPTARLELSGPMMLGHWPGGPPSAVPARIQMHAGSVLRVKGWAVLAGGSVVVVGPGAVLELEGYEDGTEGVILSTDARVICMEHVRIGGGGGLSWGAQVLDSDQHHIVVVDSEDDPAPHAAPVHIGDFVMVASRASVLKGVTIGDYSVVATGAVVTRDVPANSLVAGNPAKVVREGIRWY